MIQHPSTSFLRDRAPGGIPPKQHQLRSEEPEVELHSQATESRSEAS